MILLIVHFFVDVGLIYLIEMNYFKFLNRFFEKAMPPRDETIILDSDVIKE